MYGFCLINEILTKPGIERFSVVIGDFSEFCLVYHIFGDITITTVDT